MGYIVDLVRPILKILGGNMTSFFKVG